MKRAKVTIYKAKDGWRWRLQAGNNRIIAEGGEAYTRQRDVYRALAAVSEAMALVLDAWEEEDDWPLVESSESASVHGNC